MDGKAYGWHLKRAAKHSAAARAELAAAPALPPSRAYVWTWFCELNQARTYGPAGANPLGYGELADWERLTGRRLEPGEVALLLDLDRVWRFGADEAAEESPG